MPFAITLRLDSAATAQIDALCGVLASRGVVEAPALRAERPHLVLLRGPTIDSEAALPVLHELAMRLRPQPIRLAGLALFGPEPSVLWLVPIPDPALIALHVEVHARLSPHLFSPGYAPGMWVPAVRLAEGLTSTAAIEAAGLLLPAWRPFGGVLERIELVRVGPYEQVWGERLMVRETASS